MPDVCVHDPLALRVVTCNPRSLARAPHGIMRANGTADHHRQRGAAAGAEGDGNQDDEGIDPDDEEGDEEEAEEEASHYWARSAEERAQVEAERRRAQQADPQ